MGNNRTLSEKSLDQLAAEVAALAEGSEEAHLYHDEMVRRQEQADLDKATSELVGETKKHSVLTIVILAAAILAATASWSCSTILCRSRIRRCRLS
jgi:hypothetical protein